MNNSTKKVKIGDVYIGGGEPILIQSMTKTQTQDVKSTINQIKHLEEVGCDIIRLAVPDMEAAEAIKEIKKQISIPLVADIHFDYRLAIKSIENGANKIRINPGNIGEIEKVKMIVNSAKCYEIPIRIGINSGSLEKDLLVKYGAPTADALVESALRNIRLLEDMNFDDIVISIKSSDVRKTIQSYIEISKRVNYPLHIGVTEAGTIKAGTIKSSVGIGTLLYNAIGDTIRVSLTGNPIEEVQVAKEILSSLGLIQKGIELISCPTCGRCNVNIVKIIENIEVELSKIKTNKKIKVAVMGCAVNGPGEAREADLGIAGGIGEYLLFVKGQTVRKVDQDSVIEELIKEVNKLL